MRLLSFLIPLVAVATFCGTSSASVIISRNPSIPYFELSRGDFDASYYVDAKDLSKWKSGFGQAALNTWVGNNGDANQDLVVDGNDFLIWQRNANKHVLSFAFPSAPTSATVPEPSAAVLVGGALAWLASSRRCRR